MASILGDSFDGLANANGGGGQPVDVGMSSTDFSAVRSYLAALLPPVMAANRTDLERTLFSDENFESKVGKFAMDAGVNVAYVVKERVIVASGEEGGGEEIEENATTYTYSLHLPPVPAHSPNLLTTLSLIKSTHTLDLSQPLASQLHFVLISSPSSSSNTGNQTAGDGQKGGAGGGGTISQIQPQAAPYEGLHSVVHWGVTPMFESYVNSKTKSVSVDGVSKNGGSTGKGVKSGGDSQMGIPVAKRKFAELELSLLHLQQNVEIPEPVLVIQGAIQSAVERCRASGTRVTIDSILPSTLLTDTPFLNRLQSDVNLWIRSIQAVTKLTRDVSSGTASQEINFWLSKERALEAIDAQLNGEGVQLVLDTLKAAKRYHATTSFLADTGLRESQDESSKNNALMRDFPLNDLLSATDLEKIRESLFAIFTHLNKKLRVSPYPLRRTLPFVEAISSDFNQQCLKVLGSQRLMYMEHAMFERTMRVVMEVFGVWEENIKEFTNVAREVMRKRNEKFIPIKINSAHVKTQERLAYLQSFRRSHEQLQAMTGPGGGLRSLGTENLADIDMEAEVKRAYEYIKNVDVLDTTSDGTEIWISAENSYNERVARVENQIISALRDKLATARNAHEMFKAFSKFNSLFVRPKIRGAIQEYQTRLIDSVKADIKLLQKKFTDNYRNSEAFKMSQLRDLPPVASAIIWARQIERQLTLSMKRVEDVLGQGWELYAEGEKLKQESDAFRSKLDVRPIYDAWVQDVTRAEPKLTGRLLDIQRQRGVALRADGNPPLELAVNFDSNAIVLFKEVRNLLWLNFSVPHAIITYAKDAKRVYPHAVSLIEAVRAYNQTCETIDRNESIAMLVAGYRIRVQDLIGQGLQLRWEDISFSFSANYASMANGARNEDPAIAFFRDFAQSVVVLQDKTAVLEDAHKLIGEDLERLRICPYSFESFAGVLGEMQNKIDKLNLEAFVGFETWVADLDRSVATILGQRSSSVLAEWTRNLTDDPTSQQHNGFESTFESDGNREHVRMTSVVHELRMRNQVIYLEPPLEMTHSLWIKQCRRIFATVTSQKRLRSSRYDLTIHLKEESLTDSTFAGLLSTEQGHPLQQAIEALHAKIRTLQNYVDRWMQFQSLWDLDSEVVYEQLGDKLDRWAALLHEIRLTRSTFDTVTSQKSFGVCVVDYATIQSKVNAKYDSWQRDILSRYGQKLSASMRDSHAAIERARRDLERRSVDTSSTAEAVAIITFVEELKRKRSSWAPDIQSFQEGQRTLERQRYAFGEEWLHSDQVTGEWNAFNQILSRKDASIQEQIAGLQLKILAEDGTMHEKIGTIEMEWAQNKPIQGSVKPDSAIESIAIFESRVERLQGDQDLIWRAKQALGMTLAKDDRLRYIGEEAKDLKAVWLALSATWTQVQQLRETAWSAVQPRKIRQALDAMSDALKELPSRMRQYAAYEYAQERLRELGKVNGLITELRSDAMRERHWQTIYRTLKVGQIYRPNGLSLGTIYDLDLKRHEKTLKEVILQAQGEIALEEFLRQVKNTWEGYSLDLVNYQNKCRLIRGWDELFTKCREHLSSLNAMQASPYYRVFQEEAAGYEDKLNKVHVLFDIWIDVQRQWVYLEGIFTGNVDIKQLLPVESSRFSNINAEFMTAMKGVYKSPLVFDIIAIPGIQKTFDKLANALAKIQKALGEYLERERTAFPRFYFLGDEDLLEIIGNAKDVPRIIKHLKKMFAGIASVILSEDGSCILAMVSKDGEEVSLNPPVNLSQTPRVNEWLGKLEGSMKSSLSAELMASCRALDVCYNTDQAVQMEQFLAWLEARPVQVVLLSVQIAWTKMVEGRVAVGQTIHAVETVVRTVLDGLAKVVLSEITPSLRKKCEHLITEFVHQRDVLKSLVQSDITSIGDFSWLQHMRYYINPESTQATDSLSVRMADAQFFYGFEYLGAPEPLVQTPLTDRCYLTLTQALHNQLGGSPFGPAGTGKTESVKALGNKLGRFVLVFCCDEGFDFRAMGRIFLGISRVGAWGCFDEFNRLEERILSAVSQQIQTIQQGLTLSGGQNVVDIDLLGKRIGLHPETGIFITMNPGYAGRSNLPDNLKKLFRGVSMTRPDRELIAQVMLYSQGFAHAESLASKIVPLFQLCEEQMSKQSHYDFGLRALKSVLVRAGMLKRIGRSTIQNASAATSGEEAILIRSIQESVSPKLYSSDASLLMRLVEDLFPGVTATPVDLSTLTKIISDVCKERYLVASEAWTEKVTQLYQVQQVNHGVMLVGPEATGKTATWTVLLESLKRLDGIEGVSYVIDPKALDKERLYGQLDHTTREWSDGLVTHIVRRIIENARGESSKRHWIVFDGDVDPEWVENLNSVLDDNKLLTLPNGERLAIPDNVRFLFEVESLRFATLATVSRCGMIWYHEEVLTESMMMAHHLRRLEEVKMSSEDEGLDSNDLGSAMLQAQEFVAKMLGPAFSGQGVVLKALRMGSKLEHIMAFSSARSLMTLFSLINQMCKSIAIYNGHHSDFPLSSEVMKAYVDRKLLLALVWSIGGDSSLATRLQISRFVAQETGIELPSGEDRPLIDYDVDLASGNWVSWQSRVPTLQLETHQVSAVDIIIPTSDTVRHEDVLYSWVSERKPLILCGPPGSGKTMTLYGALRRLPDVITVLLNFSSATSPELVLKTFEQYCDYRKTPTGVVLAPQQPGKWLVIFCDEINLPSVDKYGTQRVISFMRQMIESGGFWRATDLAWVTLERIQFVGACNPPTDPGRTPLTQRFLRHAPVLLVDYPGQESLVQIYATFARAALKVIPSLRSYAQPLTEAMIELFEASRSRFTAEQQAHYIYSPRELSRWIRGIFEALQPLELLEAEGLVRIWAHEAQRLFQDRLVTQAERDWTDARIDEIAAKHFPMIDLTKALARPILFSNWTTKDYLPIDRDQLREFTKARLRTFYEEELDVPLVLFDEFLDHVLRIDRAFKQTQGHVLMIGMSGAGKTTMSRFVAWMNGLTVFTIKVSNRYTAEDFDDDLKQVLRRSGCKGEKICFILDESNILESSFLERMNTLLANSEVPGLFEDDEYTALMTACREGSQRDGLMLDTNDELYRWFSNQISRNLHVVFTMNPPLEGMADKAATSPALFNRCVLDWFGDWSDHSLYQVALELTSGLDLEDAEYDREAAARAGGQGGLTSHRNAIAQVMVDVHRSVKSHNAKLLRDSSAGVTYATPRHFLEFLQQYIAIFQEKRSDFEDHQRHVNSGLDKISETLDQVADLRATLGEADRQLAVKEKEGSAQLASLLKHQNEAETKKRQLSGEQAKLEEQNAVIEENKADTQRQLSYAAPAVEHARAAVANIKKQQLAEVRALPSPPEAIKLALEATCVLLGKDIGSGADRWKTIRREIGLDTFTSSITRFSSDQISPAIRKQLSRDYLDHPSFTVEAVYKANRACAPLVEWVVAQLTYAEILEQIIPLSQRIADYEADQVISRQRISEMQRDVKMLEADITKSKEDYARSITEAEATKVEKRRTEVKVARSVALLDSLSLEKTRWTNQNEVFAQEMTTIPGDVLISAAFQAYLGYYDQADRTRLLHIWMTHMVGADLRYRTDLSLLEYLSSPDQRAEWLAQGLPDDQVCLENAIMLKRFGRYPFIIDPSQQADEFLMNAYKSRRMIVTSFLDAAFSKNLESALRFGTPIYVKDVERIDPVLNTVLNREIRRTGGRQLIRLGNQDIDFSPAFVIFLSTRNADIQLGPDVCSRVTLVNFSLTPASLQSQSLSRVLKAERPETEARRRDLYKLQGEFKLKLRQLEKSLLQALSESSGNILDDEKVLTSLEQLKEEARSIAQKMSETETVMAEIDGITEQYTPIARACSLIYSTLEKLALLDHFYRYSLHYFVRAFEQVILRNSSLTGNRDHADRARIILRDLFLEIYRRTATTMRQEDRAVLAGTFVRIYLLVTGQSNQADDLKGALNGSFSAGDESDRLADVDWLSDGQKHAVAAVSCGDRTEILSRMKADGEAWRKVLSTNQVESCLVTLGVAEATSRLAITCALRPDRVESSVHHLTLEHFGVDFGALVLPDLASIVEHEIDASIPLVLCSQVGHDASYRVEGLIKTIGRSCEEVAMGSEECYALADAAMTRAARQGTWVLLKNTHLTPGWLDQLHKRLLSLHAQPGFRLFLTMEMHQKIPTSLLQSSRILMTEPALGLKAGLLEALGNPLAGLAKQWPTEGNRLYFLLAWFHAVMQERRRFVPLGWTKEYEFNDSDLSAGILTLHHWIKAAAKGRSNIDPKAIPWKAVKLLLKEAVYGGRIDVDHDQRVTDAFVDAFFRSEAYEGDFALVPTTSQTRLVIPEATSSEQFFDFVNSLPEQNPCTWLGLPSHSEEALAHAQGLALLSKLRRFQNTEEDVGELEEIEGDDEGGGGVGAAWKRTLEPELRKWAECVLPVDTLPTLAPGPPASPLARFWQRECESANFLLKTVRSDVDRVLSYCRGEEGAGLTNELRQLMGDLMAGDVPKSWRQYRYRSTLNSSSWIIDFANRLAHIRQAASTHSVVQLGLLLNPEGWVTATRQTAAQRDGIALERLTLVVDLDGDGGESDGKGFAVKGLVVQGGLISDNALQLNDGESTTLQHTQIRWLLKSDSLRPANIITLPVFLNGERRHQLFDVDVALEVGLEEGTVLMSGCVFLAGA